MTRTASRWAVVTLAKIWLKEGMKKPRWVRPGAAFFVGGLVQAGSFFQTPLVWYSSMVAT